MCRSRSSSIRRSCRRCSSDDQLHDTLGNIDSLHAILFNSSGDTIHNGAVRFLRADTTHIVTIDSITGHVTASDTGSARVVAQAASLQSPPETLFVVRDADHVYERDEPRRHAHVYARAHGHDVSAVGIVGVAELIRSIIIASSITSSIPTALNVADTTQILLTDENGSSLSSTRQARERALSPARPRAIFALRLSRTSHRIRSIVEARAFLPDHTPVSGSPVRFKVHVQIHARTVCRNIPRRSRSCSSRPSKQHDRSERACRPRSAARISRSRTARSPIVCVTSPSASARSASRPGDRVAILSENRPEWAIADYACLMCGIADVPIYPTLPAEQIAYILRDSGAVAIFVSIEGAGGEDSKRARGAAGARST